jgi:hypothetical protein
VFFPINVAFETQNVSTIGTLPSVFSSSEIVDADFCCKIKGANDGRLCGLFFNSTASSSNTHSIAIPLAHPSVVNELITSWAEPCANMPLTYSVFYQIPTDPGNWRKLLDRQTNGNTSCVTTNSDNGAVAICVDYFLVNGDFLVASALNVTWSAQTSNFPTGNIGWMYELAVQGVPTDFPYIIQALNSFWSSGNVKIAATKYDI